MNTIISTEGVPLYVKIREVLRTEIINGNLKRGQKIPSEDELAARYGVSRMTVRQGILDLIDEGLLYRRQGLGTFVA
ncbi:MAG: GntR family transcriptional regulator, partial [Anaerolineales bacterium]